MSTSAFSPRQPAKPLPLLLPTCNCGGERRVERQTEGWRDRQRGGMTDRWVGRQTGGWRVRQTGGEIDRWVERQTEGWGDRQKGGEITD